MQENTSFAALRKEGEQLGIVTPENAKQTKTELKQEITAARLKNAITNRGGGR
jgi:hypothetical protein